MRSLLHKLILLVWALWFGGLVMMYIGAKSLFHTFEARREVAGEAAAGMFRAFNYYHLTLAAAALLLAFLWWLSARSGRKMTLFFFFAFATFAAVYVTAVLTPQLEHMRLEGQTQSTHFRQLHGMSMGIYLLEAIFVFVAGLVIPHRSRDAEESKRDQVTLQI